MIDNNNFFFFFLKIYSCSILIKLNYLSLHIGNNNYYYYYPVFSHGFLNPLKESLHACMLVVVHVQSYCAVMSKGVLNGHKPKNKGRIGAMKAFTNARKTNGGPLILIGKTIQFL